MNRNPFAICLQQFFTDHLTIGLRASTHTIASDRDTFRLLLNYAADQLCRTPTDLTFEDLDANLVGRFLGFVETVRGNSVRSRNTRLSAIRSFFKYVATHEPQLVHHCHRILSIPAKKYERTTISYLNRAEMAALVAAPDSNTWFGRRDTPLHVNVVLIPAPNADADTGTTRFMCCYDASGAFSSDGGFARIPYLTPSHPEWATRPAWGGMSLPPDDFHAKNLMHEFTHAAQFTVGAITWPPRVPWWISEGLAEYEGMFHTTENNRTEGYDNLVRYVHDAIPHRVFCCRTLASPILTLATTDAYFGGSLMLKYLADTFGEDLHARLVRHTLPNFVEALDAEFKAFGTTAPEVFEGLRDWLSAKRAAVGGGAVMTAEPAAFTTLPPPR